MSLDYSKDVYAARLEQAHEFQDFVTVAMHRRGRILNNLQSQKYQYGIGENLAGWEIKLDNGLATHNALWIEFEEKSHPDNPIWYPSGPYRDDNSNHFAIGNYSELFVFSCNWLRRLCNKVREQKRHHGCELISNTTGTSNAVKMPRKVAEEWCCEHFLFTPEDQLDTGTVPAEPESALVGDGWDND